MLYSVTAPYCQRSAQPVAASAALHPPGTPATADSICSKGHTRQSADSFSTLGPHLCRKGRYSGQLWTVPSSAWCDTDVLHEFPPPISGPAAVATCWQASCRHGCLELVANAAAAQSAGARKVCHMESNSLEFAMARQHADGPAHAWHNNVLSHLC